MDWLIGGVGLVVGFSTLVFVHELGHYIFAKWNGVRVKVFSVGMGPYLLSFSRGGTIYVLSMVPVGGYVKMLGQEDLNADPEASKDPGDYRSKRPGQRAAILAAGAFFNLIFAFFAFTCCYYFGVELQSPRVGKVAPNSPVANARVQLGLDQYMDAPLREGDRITSVDGVPVFNFMDITLQVAGASTEQNIQIMYERLNHKGEWEQAREPVFVIPKRDEKLGATSLGIRPYIKQVGYALGFEARPQGVYVAETPAPKSAAGAAGILKGDRLLSIDGLAVEDPDTLIDAVGAAEGKSQKLIILREGLEQTVEVAARKDEKEKVWRLGIGMLFQHKVQRIDAGCEAYQKGLREGYWIAGLVRLSNEREVELAFHEKLLETEALTKIVVPKETKTGDAGLQYWVRQMEYEKVKLGTFVEALSLAWTDLIRHSFAVFGVLKGLLTGRVGFTALSGPAGIATMTASVAIERDFMFYVWFLAFLSVNLGVLQFVPIPLLDGWHLVIIGVEKLKGSPVAAKVQEYFLYAGLFIILSLLIFATKNDIMRFFIK